MENIMEKMPTNNNELKNTSKNGSSVAEDMPGGAVMDKDEQGKLAVESQLEENKKDNNKPGAAGNGGVGVSNTPLAPGYRMYRMMAQLFYTHSSTSSSGNQQKQKSVVYIYPVAKIDNKKIIEILPDSKRWNNYYYLPNANVKNNNQAIVNFDNFEEEMGYLILLDKWEDVPAVNSTTSDRKSIDNVVSMNFVAGAITQTLVLNFTGQSGQNTPITTTIKPVEPDDLDYYLYINFPDACKADDFEFKIPQRSTGSTSVTWQLGSAGNNDRQIKDLEETLKYFRNFNAVLKNGNSHFNSPQSIKYQFAI